MTDFIERAKVMLAEAGVAVHVFDLPSEIDIPEGI